MLWFGLLARCLTACGCVLGLQATTELQQAQQQAANEAAERARLEADLAGCRSWIRELERTEQQYLKTIRLAQCCSQQLPHAVL